MSGIPSNLWIGTDGDDVIDGGTTITSFQGGGGNDWIRTDAPNADISGGAGSDTIIGGPGNDHLYGYGPTTGTDGADSISANGGDDYVQGNAGNDTLDGGEGNDRIQGGADNDLIYGGTGSDQLNGNKGNDTIYGGDDADVIHGGQGNDRLYGDAGDDHIYGDLGADTVTGGAGADVFHFAAADGGALTLQNLLGGVDTVTDFTHGQDHIALDFLPTQVMHGAAQSTLAGALAIVTQLLVGGGDHSVAAVQVGNDTYLFYNTTGGLVSGNVIDLQNTNAASIDTSDFV